MSKKIIFGLYGAGGFGREVMYIAHQQFASNGIAAEIYFVETEPKQQIVNGIKNISESDFFSLQCDQKLFNVAIADSSAREVLANRCIAAGAEPLTLISPDSIVYDHDAVGPGAIICAYSMITSNVQVGKFFHSNIYSYIAHDCTVGDFVTFAPRVNCNGNIHIEDNVYVGTAASIKPGSAGTPRLIGRGSVIGMGAVVLKDVRPGAVIVGNPGVELNAK